MSANVAIRTIIDHPAPCWNCSKRLQACDVMGKPYLAAAGQSLNYSGPVQAWVVEIDGHPRRLHKACAEELGYRTVKL